MAWRRDWETLFAGLNAASSAAPRLGIDYVAASAAETTLQVRDAGLELRLRQDLAGHGIAGVVWNCARAMIAFLGDHPGLLAHGHAMELGAGPGAVGLALAAAGLVNAVTLTDLEAVLPLTRANVEFASKQSAEVAAMVRSGRLATRSLCWGERSGDSSPRPSAILCSDCLYDAAQFAPLLSTLLELTEHSRRQGGKEAPLVLVAYKQRLPAKERAFFVDASQHFDVEVYASTSSGGLVRFVDDDIFICKLRRKRLSDGGLPYADQPAKEAGNNDTK